MDLSERLPTIQGDSVQLQQVLLNLILNGADALADIEADLALKEKALKKVGPAGQKTKRFQPDDGLLRFLTSL